MPPPKSKRPASAETEYGQDSTLLASDAKLAQTPRLAQARRNATPARRQMLTRQYIAGEPHRPTHSDIEKMVALLPYGQWVCADGRVVIFNRRYSPIWERLPDGVVQRADPGEWVKWVNQSWFDLRSARYEKGARERLRKVLRDFLDGKISPSKDCVP
jgi:hypothetical protein